MLKEELQELLSIEYEKGIEFMKQKMLSVCDTDKPIEIDGRAYFVQSDKKHLHKLFNDFERPFKDEEYENFYLNTLQN